jgi:hypothetical protein
LKELSLPLDDLEMKVISIGETEVKWLLLVSKRARQYVTIVPNVLKLQKHSQMCLLLVILWTKLPEDTSEDQTNQWKTHSETKLT